MQNKSSSDFLRIKELCFLIKNGLLKNEEKIYFLELSKLYTNSSLESKAFIATDLQYTRILSIGFINLILYDSSQIAQNFIINSPSLNDEKLISFIHDNHDLIKLRYIAQRQNIGEKLKAALMKSGDKYTQDLITNTNSSLHPSQDIIISDTSLTRQNHLSKKYFELSIHDLTFNELSNSVIFKKIKRDFDTLTKTSHPNYTFLIRYLCRGMPLSFLYLLSKKSDISFSMVFDIFINQQDSNQIFQLLRKSNMPVNFCTVTSKLFSIILKGMRNEKLTPNNLQTYLLKNVKDIDSSDISREISYIEKMI